MRRNVFRFLALALGVVVAVVFAEASLRVLSIGPWTPYGEFAELPSMTLPDPKLGWVNRPGYYPRTPVPDARQSVEVTIGELGRRRPSVSSVGAPSVWMMGGSFIFGFGVDDTQTLPAAMGALRPDLQVDNWGVPGFGTVQSRGLFLEAIDVLPPPQWVIYGLVDYHDARNVAAPSWLYGLDRAAGPNPWVQVPSVALVDGRLVDVPPRGYAHWPMSERFSVVYLLERAIVALRDWGTADKTEVTVQVIKAWQGDVRRQGGELLVAILYAPEAGAVYRQRLREEGVRFVDLVDDGYPGPDLALPGDGHPTSRLYAQWARELQASVQSTSR